jgi:ADP-ribose pyrophosphatase
MRSVVQRTTLHRGPLFEVERVTVRDDAGGEHVREVVRHPGAVVILPVMDDGRLILIRNERVAVGENLWELPAGTREPNEPTIDTARRELEEETGYRADSVEAMGHLFTTPGFCDERIELFLASGLAHVGQNLDAGERIEVHPTPLADVLQMIDDGRIHDGKSVAAVLLWRCRADRR